MSARLTFWTLMLILLGSLTVYAQSTHLVFEGDVGRWRTLAGIQEDAYTNSYQKWFSCAAIGVGLELGPPRKIGLALRGSLDYSVLQYEYRFLGGASAEADMEMLTTMLAVGFRSNPFGNLQIRLFAAIRLASGAWGSYVSRYYVPNTQTWTTYTYENQFRRIRRIVNLGPMWSLGWKFPLKGGSYLEPGLNGSLSTFSIFKQNSPAPHNPRAFQTQISMAWGIPIGHHLP